jgi:hypothetical protein
MYTYNYRLRDRFNRPVASFAILGDDSRTWRPDCFETALWGCQTRFQFPTVKLLDYEQQWAALEASESPFATVVMAHLKTLETKEDAVQRQQWKIRLAKGLFQKGYERQAVIDLLKFIDWLVVLPEGLEQGFWETLLSYQEEQRMKYVTTLERFAEERGRQEGLQEGRQEGLAKERALVIRLLRRKVGDLPEAMLAEVEGLSFWQVESLGEALLAFESLADLEHWWEQLRAKQAEVLLQLTQHLGEIDESLAGQVRTLSVEWLTRLAETLSTLPDGDAVRTWLEAQEEVGE